ncbi:MULTISPECIES: entericidin A/B family lipoprotein [Thalassotalea]|nr:MULTISPECIES: entericidin A/B family lipoprotein [Thalassotalea]
MKPSKLLIKLQSVLMLTIFAISVSACATIEGAGKDIESAGEAVQDAADN